MIALDTNLLVRLFVNDDVAQAAKVRDLFDAHSEDNDSLWIADVVLAELTWALGRTYGRTRSDIAIALRALSENATVLLESAGLITEAIALYESGPADFVDCLLAVKARAIGCEALCSYDKKMRKLPGVRLL